MSLTCARRAFAEPVRDPVRTIFRHDGYLSRSRSALVLTLTVVRAALYDITGALAVAKLALVALRELPASLIYPTGEPETFKEVKRSTSCSARTRAASLLGWKWS